jgi:inorganic pyrophosphatase
MKQGRHSFFALLSKDQLSKTKKKSKLVDVIIETPKGSRNKYAWNEKKKIFELKKTLPLGHTFPFDFGFIPKTKGQDGDPLDVLLIMDEPAYPGIFTSCRLIGILQAVQKEKDGRKERNDRYIAISETCVTYDNLKDLKDLPENLRNEIEHFFVSYNEEVGKAFKPIKWGSADDAWKAIRKACK